MVKLFLLTLRNRQSGKEVAHHILRPGRYHLTTSVDPDKNSSSVERSIVTFFEGTLTVDQEGICIFHDRHRKQHRWPLGSTTPYLQFNCDIHPMQGSRDELWRHLMRTYYERFAHQKLTEEAIQNCFSSFTQENDLSDFDADSIVESLKLQLLGLGPLEEHLRDPEVTEILVNGTSSVFIEKQGQLQPVESRFLSHDELCFTCEKLALYIDRPFSPLHPVCEGVWTGGERIEVIHETVAPEGPLISIRRHHSLVQNLETWLAQGALTKDECRELKAAVIDRRNLLIAGTTGSGKTTLLQALTHEIPPQERWISIEDTAELSVRHPGHIRLLTKIANQDGHGEVSMPALIKCGLRLRPDRFVIGEVRGQEALFMLQALSTGHSGSMGTVHARNAEEAKLRMVLMASMHPQAPGLELMTSLVESVIDGIIIVNREPNGQRRIQEMKWIRSTRWFSAGVSLLNSGNLERDSVVAGTQNTIGQNNDDKLTVLGHSDRRIENIATTSRHEKGCVAEC